MKLKLNKSIVRLTAIVVINFWIATYFFIKPNMSQYAGWATLCNGAMIGMILSIICEKVDEVNKRNGNEKS